MVHKVTDLVEDGLAVFVFANHYMVVAHRLWVYALHFVVLLVGMQAQNLKPFETLCPGKQEILVARCSGLASFNFAFFVRDLVCGILTKCWRNALIPFKRKFKWVFCHKNLI